MLSNRHFKGCFGRARQSAAAHLRPDVLEGRGFNPAKNSAASEGQGFNLAKKSGATRLPLGGPLAEPSARFAQAVPPRARRLLHGLQSGSCFAGRVTDAYDVGSFDYWAGGDRFGGRVRHELESRALQDRGSGQRVAAKGRSVWAAGLVFGKVPQASARISKALSRWRVIQEILELGGADVCVRVGLRVGDENIFEFDASVMRHLNPHPSGERRGRHPEKRPAGARHASRPARTSTQARIASIRATAPQWKRGAPAPSEGRGFNPAEKSGAQRLPLGGLLAEPSANLAQPVPAHHARPVCAFPVSVPDLPFSAISNPLPAIRNQRKPFKTHADHEF